jgi:hypothetical protein
VSVPCGAYEIPSDVSNCSSMNEWSMSNLTNDTVPEPKSAKWINKRGMENNCPRGGAWLGPVSFRNESSFICEKKKKKKKKKTQRGMENQTYNFLLLLEILVFLVEVHCNAYFHHLCEESIFSCI